MNEKEMNKNIGIAKRIYTNDKKVTFATDKIGRSEAKYFVDDEFLAEKIKEKQEIDKDIIEYITETLKNERKEIPEEDKDKIIGIKCDLEHLMIECIPLENYDFMNEIKEALSKMVNTLNEKVVD